MKNISGKKKKIFWLAPIILLVIAIIGDPVIGYYTLLRLVVCTSALYFAYNFYKKNNQSNIWIFSFIAVLYNPILPFYLYEKDLWRIVNIFTIYFIYKNRKLN